MTKYYHKCYYKMTGNETYDNLKKKYIISSNLSTNKNFYNFFYGLGNKIDLSVSAYLFYRHKKCVYDFLNERLEAEQYFKKFLDMTSKDNLIYKQDDYTNSSGGIAYYHKICGIDSNDIYLYRPYINHQDTIFLDVCNRKKYNVVRIEHQYFNFTKKQLWGYGYLQIYDLSDKNHDCVLKTLKYKYDEYITFDTGNDIQNENGKINQKLIKDCFNVILSLCVDENNFDEKINVNIFNNHSSVSDIDLLRKYQPDVDNLVFFTECTDFEGKYNYHGIIETNKSIIIDDRKKYFCKNKSKKDFIKINKTDDILNLDNYINKISLSINECIKNNKNVGQ